MNRPTLEDNELKMYEGMFLVATGQPNFDEAVAPIQTIFERNSAEVLQLKKWDERRLAYDVRGQRRGLYVLTYFKADPEKISDIERDVQLSEPVLRVLILAAEHVTPAQMSAPTPADSVRPRRDSDRHKPRETSAGDGAAPAGDKAPAETTAAGEAAVGETAVGETAAAETPAAETAAAETAVAETAVAGIAIASLAANSDMGGVQPTDDETPSAEAPDAERVEGSQTPTEEPGDRGEPDSQVEEPRTDVGGPAE